ncbi:hypothetical protein G4Y79_09655 [Phototrophicus methaneseepsis]|uniref:Solute-binding protein family 5 domain-containing protein n=1 Tax=Phototrophicus methaneseepsis TaxID=2710758 RepID=A0A7S8ECW1_9CHLR|nr:ABC transporter substrate-binding protein [Phototrophicus methaneseepsis]QPC84621.1 hypothetical protein G4Y79_09655 [Phototrophicus methaneseepsis]
MKRYSLLLLIGLLVMAALPITAQEDDTLIWAFPADGSTFNSILQVETVDSLLQGLVMPRLSRNNLVTGEAEPDLATWEISEDGLTYTFSINPDAVWSDGTPITSEDVAFTVNALFEDSVEGFRAISNFETLNIIDDKTFEMVFTAPTCNLFTEVSFSILPSHVYADDYSDFSTNSYNTQPTVSGGPYVFVERSTDEYMRFAANETYYGGTPNIDQLVVQVMPDPEVRFQALESGQVDLVTTITPDQALLLESNPDVVLETYPINGWIMNMFNLTDPDNPLSALDEDGNLVEQAPHPILGDVRVREALVMGWDHEDGLFLAGDGALPLYGPVAPVLPQYIDEDLEPYTYDMEGAIALLEEAGWTDSDGDGIRDKEGEPLALELIYLAGYDDVATLIADYWGDLGVDVTLTTGEQGAMIADRLSAQNFDAFIIGISWDSPTPDELLKFLYPVANDMGTNFNSYINEEVDSLIADLPSLGCAVEDRKPTYDRIQELISEDVPMDFMYTQVGRVAYSPQLGNYEITSWGYNPIQEWTLGED